MDDDLEVAVERVKDCSTDGTDLIEGMLNIRAMFDNDEFVYSSDIEAYNIVYNKLKPLFV